jgi:hypothetical protein
MKQVFGGILLAVGILIAGASGLCSLAILLESGQYSGAGMLPAVLIFGGIPFAIGVAIAFGGYALIRSARNERDREGE